MNSLTKELFFGSSAQLYPENTLSSFTNLLPEQLNLESQWEVANSDLSYPSMYQKVTEGKLMFLDESFSKSSETYYLEPSLYLSNTEIVAALNTLVQELHNHSESYNNKSVSKNAKSWNLPWIWSCIL